MQATEHSELDATVIDLFYGSGRASDGRSWREDGQRRRACDGRRRWCGREDGRWDVAVRDRDLGLRRWGSDLGCVNLLDRLVEQADCRAVLGGRRVQVDARVLGERAGDVVRLRALASSALNYFRTVSRRALAVGRVRTLGAVLLGAELALLRAARGFQLRDR